MNRSAWFSRPWRGATPDHASTTDKATIYSVAITMVSGRKYVGQVKTGRDYRAALDLFYWRICGLMAGKGVCLEVSEASAEPMLRNVSWNNQETVRVLGY